MSIRVIFTKEEKEEDIKDVEKMLRENMSYSQIASLLGRSVQYIADIRTYLKENGKLTEEELMSIKSASIEKKQEEIDKKVLTLLSQGYTKNEIHFKLNISSSNVNNSLERIEASGIDTKQFKTKKELEKEARKKKIIEFIEKGYYVEKIVSETLIPRTTVNRLIEELIAEEKIRREDVKTSKECLDEINKERNCLIKELLKQGLSIKEISEIVDVCNGTVYNVINDRVQKNNYKKIKKEISIKEVDDNLTKQEKEIINYLKLGYSYVTIRKLLEMSQPDLMQIVKKLKNEHYISQTIINEALNMRKEYYRKTIKRLITNGYSQSDILRYLNQNAEEVTGAYISRTITELLENNEITLDEIQCGIDESSSSYKKIDANILELLKQGLTVKEIIEADEDGYLTESRVRRSKKRLIDSGKITENEIVKYRNKKAKEDRNEIYKEEEKIIWGYVVNDGLTIAEISEKTGQCSEYIMARMLNIRKKKKITLKDIYRIRKEAKEKKAQKYEEMQVKEENKKLKTLKKYQEIKDRIKKLIDEGIDNTTAYDKFVSLLYSVVELKIKIAKEDVDILSYIVLYSSEHNTNKLALFTINLYLSIFEFIEAEKFLNMYYQWKKYEADFYQKTKKLIMDLKK